MVKDDKGSLTTLFDDLAGNQTTYVGEPGKTYTFRVRARDNVNNVGAWVESEPVEVGAAVTKYYSFGGQRVAMRQGDVIYYLHGDHLGSTSLTTDDTGAIISEVRYLPYGQERWTNGVSVTDFGFTSQRNEASFGLMDYNARYYSPLLGRFVSPDTIVPDPTSSGGFNRYRYTRNNPLKYTNPSGHQGCDEEVEDCEEDDEFDDEELLQNGEDGNEENQINNDINPEILIPDGGALRLDASVMVGVGFDANIDIVWLWNTHSMETLIGDSIFAGGAYGAEVEGAYAQNPDGSPAISIYAGGGPPVPFAGVPAYGGGGRTYSGKETYDQTMNETGPRLVDEFEKAIWHEATKNYWAPIR